MNNSFSIDKSLSKEEKYKLVLKQTEALLNRDEPIISNLSNVTALLKDAFDTISWVGFYLRKDSNLYLGPFQGKVACTVINIGNGVCGLSAKNKESIIVDDVLKFDGHIACDADTRSEIVVPLFKEGEVLAVLDLDSHQYSSFDLIDKTYLTKLCNLIVDKLDIANIGSILI